MVRLHSHNPVGDVAGTQALSPTGGHFSPWVQLPSAAAAADYRQLPADRLGFQADWRWMQANAGFHSTPHTVQWEGRTFPPAGRSTAKSNPDATYGAGRSKRSTGGAGTWGWGEGAVRVAWRRWEGTAKELP